MGCNCGSSRPPAGSTPAPPRGNNPSTTRIGPPPQGTGTGQTESFALRTPDGQRREYGSRLERDAARVRGGGTVE